MLAPDRPWIETVMAEDGLCVSAGATDEVIRRWKEKQAVRERMAVVKGLIAEYESQIVRLQTELAELARNARDATAA